MIHFDLEAFIARHVTGRQESMFAADMAAASAQLSDAVRDRSVLVIGGAGSIGSSFIKALLPFRPDRLVVVDTNENGLTELTRDLRSTEGLPMPPVYRTYPMDFGDPVFRKLWRWQGPFDIVANFAAHKHVRSEKDRYSIEAMLGNNVFKAGRLLEELAQRPPAHFFCVSTDKAANPVNVMGASKKLMEELIRSYADRLPITTARFANVAFSNGSLPAGFLERLMKRQPLSAPADVLRYFVSPRESGQICLLACLAGRSGEIFFPRLAQGEMKTFASIATALLETLGLEPWPCASEEEARRRMQEAPRNGKWPVYFFNSDTSGEKPYEEFFTAEETVDLDRFRALGVIRASPPLPSAVLQAALGRLEGLFEESDLDKAAIIGALSEVVPGFRHLETGRSLDNRM
ncbi:MAG: hypothetical protein RLY31_2683 [Bacteroidota bacterium]